jgi:predicted dehydrogenase
VVVRKLRLGVIGAGTWAVAAHLPAFAARDDVEPLIVCRRDPALLEEIRSRFGFAKATTDWREVIAARPDIVALTGPVTPRAEQARAALEAGAHVLAEKPFTVDPKDAWSLTVLARQHAKTLALCYGWNEMGIVEHARRLLHEDGGVGKVEHVSVVMATVVRDLLTTGLTYVDIPIDSPPRLETWGDAAVSGGGFAHGQLTHGLGLLFRLLPQRATQVAAYTAQPPDSAVELHEAIALRLEDGIIGTVSGAALPWGTFGNVHQLQIRVTGDRGQLHLDLDRPLARRSRGEGDDVTVELSEEDRAWSFQRVVDRFVGLAQGTTTENRSPGELGARVVEVLDAMTRSAASGNAPVAIEGGERTNQS